LKKKTNELISFKLLIFLIFPDLQKTQEIKGLLYFLIPVHFDAKISQIKRVKMIGFYWVVFRCNH